MRLPFSPGSQRPDPQSSLPAQASPLGSWQRPRDRHRRAGACASHAVSGASATQRPSSPGASQRSHTPSQALSQHTPSTHWPSAQSPAPWQACPRSATGSMQLPALEQSCPAVHVSAQQRELVPTTACTHCPDAHSAALAHSRPSGSRHCPRPAQVRPSSPHTPSGELGSTATQLPSAGEHTSHSPSQASAQHTESTQ